MKTSRLSIISIACLLALTGCVPGNNKSSSSQGSSEPTSSSEVSSESSSAEQSSSSSQSSSQETDYVIQEPTEITIWTTYNDNYQTIINNAIDEFKEIEPNVTVKNIKQNGSYADLAKMVTDGFAVDNYPDMCAAYPDAASDFILNMKGLDITPYMTDPKIGWTKADFNDIPENYIALGQNYALPGTYSLPASKSTEAMFYNQDALLGLNLSSYDATINDGNPLNATYFEELTWEELFDVLIPALDAYDTAEKAAGRPGIIDKSDKWAYVGYDSDENLFITLAEQYGYGYTGIDEVTGNGKLLFNNDNMKNLMKKFKGYVDKNYLTTANILNDRPNNIFTKDHILFSIGSTGGVKYQFDSNNAHNIGVALLPHAEGRDPALIAQGPDFAFLNHKNENRAKATWLFFKLFTNKKYNTAWALETGYSPIRYSVLESSEYRKIADEDRYAEKTYDKLFARNAFYAASVTDYFFTSAVFKGSSEARAQVGTVLQQCANSTDLDAEIDTIFNNVENAIAMKM